MASLLFVDDTVDTCDMLCRLFSRYGHKTACVHDGSEVVGLMRQRHFDLVLLDVMMPGTDGFEVLSQIRAESPPVGSTPVAMYTAMSRADDQARAKKMGANEWIVKGSPFATLRQRVESLLTGVVQ